MTRPFLLRVSLSYGLMEPINGEFHAAYFIDCKCNGHLCHLDLTGKCQVPPEQAARLGTDLTPLGSERAGNADGSIPAWTGGITSPPEGIGYEKGKHLPDPFAADKPLVRINADNMDDHDAFLTRGQKALMAQYGSYFMDVYPTRRSCAQPEFVYDAAKRNAGIGELVADGNGVAKAIMASPFRFRIMRWKLSGTIHCAIAAINCSANSPPFRSIKMAIIMKLPCMMMLFCAGLTLKNGPPRNR